ncbi:DUF4097 family beta strand repeat-containing protein [Thalassotalea sp. PS06]|uniref:DUF4097 family beta strand repeat-containing protein n=1 Tax=Thalassotalea sp. PS06 TaxID=2594005 RepID=UPI001164D1D6|nr:DUF4097 family beta strand repeat-containing protein [Thalassotalea sp. PS06]QDP00403.1 hypothetical protein FNC98_02970 [Thalassotalea sp. PS06]
MKKLSLISLTLASLMTFQAHADADRTEEKTFDLSGKGELLVDNVNGNVEITAWDQNQVMVKAIVTADDEDDLENIEVKMRQSGDRISVETDYKERGGWGGGNSSGSVEYIIQVPANIDLKEIDLVNGALRVEGVRGELNADMVNGSIEATELASDVEVDAVNGGIELTFADDAKNLDIEVETVNGGIRIYLPENFGANIDASTGNGSIRTEFGLTGEKGKYYGTDLNGKFGDGSSSLDLESVNGSIRVMKK